MHVEVENSFSCSGPWLYLPHLLHCRSEYSFLWSWIWSPCLQGWLWWCWTWPWCMPTRTCVLPQWRNRLIADGWKSDSSRAKGSSMGNRLWRPGQTTNWTVEGSSLPTLQSWEWPTRSQVSLDFLHSVSRVSPIQTPPLVYFSICRAGIVSALLRLELLSWRNSLAVQIC